MPIQEKDLGKYNRPGIYIEEINNSIVDSPVQNTLINLIPGFSKKGPYNNPTYVENKTDFYSIFGTIDYQLERKGSYFHRTCLKMLETGPIWALNLLDTESNRDQLNYVSISTTALYSNSSFDNPYIADYERFFNRQDFWVRDTESFLNVVNDTSDDLTRLLHITNMGEKTISIFLFKSDATNFDVTAETWYEGATNVPQYIQPKSLMSDFLVDVLILSGDWTDYNALSVDTTWSNYFTEDGLIIDNISDFVNETGVDVLANYDVSLIPNFKDNDDRDMYIESVINNDTDKTNLYCTYNEDLLLDSDYPTNLIDMVGDTIVGVNIDNINFLSYNQDIKEDIDYPNINLDSINNVFAPDIVSYGTNYGTSQLNWSTKNISYSSFDISSLGVEFTASSGAEYIINGVNYDAESITSTVILDSMEDGLQRQDIIYLDSDGFQVEKGIEVVSGGTFTLREINFSNENTIILGTIQVVNNGGTYSGTYVQETVGATGFIPLDVTLSSVTSEVENYLLVEFNNTLGSVVSNSEYSRMRSDKYFNELSTNLDANKGVIVKDSAAGKTEIIDPTSVQYTTSSNSIVKIYLDTPSDYEEGAIYYIDKEFTYTSGLVMETTYTSDENVVAKYSDFYIDYVNGNINSGDYVNGDVDNTLSMYVDDDVLTVNFVESPTTPIAVTSDLGNRKQTVEIEKIDSTNLTNIVYVYVNKDRYSEVKRGDYLEAYYDDTQVEIGEQPRTLTRIIDIKNDSVDTTLKILYTDAPIKISEITGTDEMFTTTYPSIYKYATNLKGALLSPFKIHQDSIPDGTEQRLEDILDVLSLGTQMFKGLTNKNKISWRYLVDSFGLGLSNSSKQQYLDLCGEKLNCLGFINMPSAKQFKNSSNPSYTNDDGSLNIEYIKDGANQDKNPDFLYTFGTGVGRSTVGYFFPYVKDTVDSITKEVPPAASVASAYMRKQLSNVAGTYPWTIVAGITNGRVSDIGGTEMDFTNDDLTNFSSMGANPITFIRNVGYTINDENTAEVYPISSLSYLHSREVLIELENELYDMLLRYQWKFNTPAIRSEMKYRADRICQRYVDSGALYAFKNVCDSTNNTNYIIDLQGGVLDTAVEIVKGLKWIVNNITIEKTGAINSTGFQQ